MKNPMNKEQNKRALSNYAKYSSMAFQMLVIILLGIFAGYKLDLWLHTKPVLTILLSLSSVILAIYFVTRDLLRKK
jgi:F0F1-type ATP synthase assembly protein I